MRTRRQELLDPINMLEKWKYKKKLQFIKNKKAKLKIRIVNIITNEKIDKIQGYSLKNSNEYL